MCENPQFDEALLEIKARKYGLKFPFHYRAFDLHSIAQAKYLEINDKFSLKAHPFSFPWHGWIWVIDSLESVKRDIVEAEMDIKYPLPDDHPFLSHRVVYH
jgi:CYTH domain-containing protein